MCPTYADAYDWSHSVIMTVPQLSMPDDHILKVTHGIVTSWVQGATVLLVALQPMRFTVAH